MNFSLRPATRSDAAAVRALIRLVRINPMGLDWRRFLVAVDEAGRLVGCGQIKPHADGTRELASIAVQPEWRGRGVARAIIERLLAAQRPLRSAPLEPGAENAPPLYLTCAARLGPLYEKFGFRRLQPDEMPPYFRRIGLAARAIRFFIPRMGDLWVMLLE